MIQRRLMLGAVLALSLIVGIAPALAAPGGKGKGGGKDDGGGGGGGAVVSINESGPYSIGDEITFTVAGSSSSNPWVRLACSQGGERVYFEANPVNGNYYSDGIFDLGPTSTWTSGSAHCVADAGFHAKNGRWRSEGTLTFQVGG